MHLARGQFYLSKNLEDYVRNVDYDNLFPATIIIMATDEVIRWGAHLYPKFIAFDNIEYNSSPQLSKKCFL